jgi:ferredoxin
MKSLSQKSVKGAGDPAYVIARVSQLGFVPPALTAMVRAQLEDDGLSPAEEEVERRISAIRRSADEGGPDPLFAFALDDMPADAEGTADPADLANRSTILGFAFANVCAGLEVGGEYLWINELHVASGARRRGIGGGILAAPGGLGPGPGRSVPGLPHRIGQRRSPEHVSLLGLRYQPGPLGGENPVKTAVVFFSGTGSTEFCARRLAASLEESEPDSSVELIPLDLSRPRTPDAGARGGHAESAPASYEDIALPEGTERLAILFPVHAGDAPGPVRSWAAGLKPPGNGRRMPTAVLSVSGGGALWPNNDSRRRVIRDLERRGYAVFYEDMLVMPSNWTVATPAELVPLLYRAAQRSMAAVAGDLTAGTLRRSPIAPASAMVSWMAALERRGARRFGRNIAVGDACTSCGWCADHCPAGNISMDDDGRPAFDDSCELCMRCLYGCPADALDPHYLGFFKIRGDEASALRKAGGSTDAATAGDAGDEKTRALIDSAARGIIWSGVKRYLRRWLC